MKRHLTIAALLSLGHRQATLQSKLLRVAYVFAASALSAGCQFKPETNLSKAENKGAGPESSGPTLTNRLATGGVNAVYEMLASQIMKKDLLLPTISHPQFMRLGVPGNTSSDQWKNDLQNLQDSLDSQPELSQSNSEKKALPGHDLFCSAWFDIYSSGQQAAFKGRNNAGKEVLALQQVKYCLVAQTEKPARGPRFAQPLLKAIQNIKSWCQGNKKAKPFAMHRALEVTFHAAAMNRPDIFICSPWQEEEQGNINLMNTVVQYSYKRTCYLSCPSNSRELSCSLAESGASYDEYAAYPTEGFVQRTKSQTGTGGDESCDP